MVFSEASEILCESTFRTMNWTLSQQSQNSQDDLAGERKICVLCLFFSWRVDGTRVNSSLGVGSQDAQLMAVAHQREGDG